MLKKMLENKKIFGNKKIQLALFLFIVAVGVYYPVSKIIRFEFPFSPPAVFRFQATLYDPYDIFRGRYVALAPTRQTVIASDMEWYKYNESKVYAVLEEDEDGLAKVVDLVKKPEPGKPAVRVESAFPHGRWGGRGLTDKTEEDVANKYTVNFPFDRFYMNEKLAPEAEVAVNKAVREGGEGCVIVVKVYADGNFAITDLEIGGVPIREFLKKERGEEKR